MKYELQRTSLFKKDYKIAVKRGLDTEQLKAVIGILADGKPLPAEYRDHSLKGKYSGYSECHIQPDWLLIYKITESLLVLSLYRTGTHSDLFA